MRSLKLLISFLLASTAAFASTSAITTRLDDPQAVYLHAAADGTTDDSGAVQQAIDAAYHQHNEGIVFIPQGRYRITRTIYLWPGVRLIGYGDQRPVFVLAANTPGYNDGIAYMFFFAGSSPSKPVVRQSMPGPFTPPPTPPGTVPPITNISDANPGTFYSAISNVDFDIADGNAGAVAIRFHAAQHAFLSHIDFHIGSGFAAIHEVANEAHDLHFFGGRYGIMARKPSPAWQFTLIDSTFEGQREAAIRENEAGLTLVHDSFRHVPTAVMIDKDYSDQLWIKNSHFEDISGPAVLISRETSRMTEINIEDAACRNVPIFAHLRDSGRNFSAPSPIYSVSAFSHGLTFTAPNIEPTIQSSFKAASLSSFLADTPAIRPLPPSTEWVNIHTLGVTGDGKTDDTAAIQQAIATHDVLYFPSGRYLLHDTITLRPNSILIGLDPSTTQFDLSEGTPAYLGPGAPKPLLVAPTGGNAIMSGLGIFTGGFNDRAVGLLWHSGKDSLVDDVRFLGGHGTNAPDGSRANPYNNTHGGDPDLHKPWDAQYPSLWIDGGGGTFANLWTPDTYAQGGMFISNTTVPGFVYEVSSEHHSRNEFKLSHVENWNLYALQTEEESGESQFASSLEIDDSRSLTIANYHGYRVTHSEQPYPYAVRVSHSNNINFRNVHVDGNSSAKICDATSCRQIVRSNKVPFQNAIVDDSLHLNLRDREFAFLDLDDTKPLPRSPLQQHVVVAATAQVERLATGFFNISGAAVDSKGTLYFVDARFQRIYRWSPTTHNAEVVRDAPLGAVNLAFDKSDNLIVLSSQGMALSAYSFRPDQPQSSEGNFTALPLEPFTAPTSTTFALPVDYWFNGDFANTLSTTQPYTYISLEDMFRKSLGSARTHQFVSPDHSLVIPTDLPLVQGPPYWGTKWTPILMAYQLTKAMPGETFYASNEAEQRTYRGKLNPDGSLANINLFTERGGESLATDHAGNVYIAAGQVYVYSPAAKQIDTINVPERPHDILFGGSESRTLYLLSEHSLYSIHLR